MSPEEWTDTRTAEELAWEQKVQMQAKREGSGVRQNDILRNELGKGAEMQFCSQSAECPQSVDCPHD